MTTPADWWSTAVTRIEPGVVELRGYPVQDLIGAVSFAQTVWLLVTGELPTPGQARLVEAALVAAVDHGPQAPSIAGARMAASCGIGLNNAMATGVNMLGDVHGGAGQQCVALLNRIVAGEPAAEAVTALTAAEQHVPGFGHRFHPRDPRRDPLVALVQAAVDAGEVAGRHLAAALALEALLGPRVPMNIDGATAIVYAELGLAPELARGLFVLSRSVGILAHAWEEKSSGSRIKGPMPPSILPTWTGHPTRHLEQA